MTKGLKSSISIPFFLFLYSPWAVSIRSGKSSMHAGVSLCGFTRLWRGGSFCGPDFFIIRIKHFALTPNPI